MGCWAGPGRPYVTNPVRHPPRWMTNRPGVPGRARSVRTRVTLGSVTAVGVPGWARSAFCDGPGPTPPTTNDWPAGSAEPGPVGLTNPSSVTDRRSEFIYKIWPLKWCHFDLRTSWSKKYYCLFILWINNLNLINFLIWWNYMIML